MTTVKRNAGFTLVELAIVLVIIGLLVGGVLVGQDLIKAAEIRAVSSDLQKYDTGAAAFRTKYTGIPGDLTSTKATSFSLTTGAGTDGLGDGDGILENNNGTTGLKTGLGGENVLFWRQLSDAQFIPFGSTGTSAVVTTAAINTGTYAETMDPIVPKLRIRDIAYTHAAGSTGLNYYWIGAWNSAAGGTTGAMTISDGLSPREASGVDQKVDDGNAARGVVLSVAGALEGITAPSGGAATPAAGDCYNTTAGTTLGQYNTSTEALANALGCGLRIRAQF